MKKIIIVMIAVTAVGFGCATKSKDMLAPELAEKAMVEFEKKRYGMAIDTFEKLLDWYPFDKLATLAEFKIAESHFKMKEYDEAVIYYKDFVKMHPRNEAVPYVMSQIAQAYYKRVDSVDRDQNNARYALSAFREIIQRFPGSKYAKEAEQNATKCLKSIAGHEIYVGEFYYKSKHYKAALKRFETVLTSYPELGYDKDAEKYIAMCNAEISLNDTDVEETEKSD